MLLCCHAYLSGARFLSIVGMADCLAQAMLQLLAVHDNLLCMYCLDRLSVTTTTLYVYVNRDGSLKQAGQALHTA